MAIKKIIFLFIIALLVVGCVANGVYDKELKKVILGRVVVFENDKEYSFIEVHGSGIKSFVKQPAFGNIFGADIYGDGLVVGNAEKSEYKLNMIYGRYNELIVDKKFPAINVQIGLEEGIYYFGCIVLKYDGNKLIDIKIENNLEEDLDDAKQYISGYKKLNIIDLTDKIKEQINNKN